MEQHFQNCSFHKKLCIDYIKKVDSASSIKSEAPTGLATLLAGCSTNLTPPIPMCFSDAAAYFPCQISCLNPLFIYGVYFKYLVFHMLIVAYIYFIPPRIIFVLHVSINVLIFIIYYHFYSKSLHRELSYMPHKQTWQTWLLTWQYVFCEEVCVYIVSSVRPL